MKLGLAIPQVSIGGEADPSLIRQFVERAEQLGFGSLWVMEMGVTKGKDVSVLDSLAVLSYAAGLTSEILLGTSILLSGLRDPIWLAKSISTIDQLSAGRTIIGVGLGDRDRAELFGVPESQWIPRFEEGLSVMKSLWAEGPSSFQGGFWSLDGVEILPKPAQRPHPPIWFGAHKPRALRRAARLGDGWMGAGASSLGDFSKQASQIARYLGEESRRSEDFAISKRVYMSVDTDLSRADSEVRKFFDGVYGDAELGLRCAIMGSPTHCVSELKRLQSIGADLAVINPIYDYANQLEIIGSEVLPAFT